MLINEISQLSDIFSEIRFPSLLSEVSIPPAVEKVIGNLTEKDIINQFGGLYANEAANTYVDAIGQKLAAASDRPDFGYKFQILKSNIPQAVANINGNIFITYGLLRILRNDAQLANILAHENEHIVRQHGANQMAINIGVAGFLGLATAILGGILSTEQTDKLKTAAFGVITNGYSRQNENEADKYGQALAAKANFDPSGMVDVMTIFAALEKNDPKSTEIYMRSHPYATDRLQLASDRLSQLQKGELGIDSYKKFLINILGVKLEEAGSSPTSIPQGSIPENPILQTNFGSYLIPSIIAISGGAIFLFAILKK